MHLALPGLSVRRKRHELVMNSEIRRGPERRDRKSTRLNSSHVRISYAVFCLKKKIDRKSTHLNSSHVRISYAVISLDIIIHHAGQRLQETLRLRQANAGGAVVGHKIEHAPH